jgi:hypothetical protein
MQRILLILTFSLATIFAQDKDHRDYHWKDWKDWKGSARGYFMIGGLQTDLGDFNDDLSRFGYEDMDDKFFSLGGGGHVVKNGLIFGIEGHGFMGEEKLNQGYNTRLIGGYGFVNIGYELINYKNFSLYPLIGLGGGAIEYSMVQDARLSFDDVLADPGRTITLRNAGFMIQAALGTEFFYPMHSNEHHEWGLVFGLRGGYVFTPITSDWWANEDKISGGPDLGINGPYLRLTIGFGGNGKGHASDKSKY